MYDCSEIRSDTQDKIKTRCVRYLTDERGWSLRDAESWWYKLDDDELCALEAMCNCYDDSVEDREYFELIDDRKFDAVWSIDENEVGRELWGSRYPDGFEEETYRGSDDYVDYPRWYNDYLDSEISYFEQFYYKKDNGKTVQMTILLRT